MLCLGLYYSIKLTEQRNLFNFKLHYLRPLVFRQPTKQMNLPSVQYSYANANIAYDERNVYNNAVQLPCGNFRFGRF
jgi:hypothetical protein